MSTAPKTPTAPANAHWSATAAGAYILQWERAQYDAAVTEIFGYYAMQVGGMGLQTLAESRIQQRWPMKPQMPTRSRNCGWITSNCPWLKTAWIY